MMTLTAVQMQLADLDQKIRTVQKHILRTIQPLNTIRFHDGDVDGAEQPDFDDRDWPFFSTGRTWGGHDRLCWFRMPFTYAAVPGNEKPGVLIQPGKRFVFRSSEGGDLREYELLVYLDGRPLQSIDVRRTLIPLHDLVKPGERHLLALEAFSGLETHVHVFEQADLVAIHPLTEAFYYTARNLLDCLIAIGESHAAFPRLIAVLERALLQVDFFQTGTAAFFDSIARADEMLQKELGPEPTPAAGAPAVLCLGHSHLDLAWKWRVRHSIQKAARTCANALRLMELYPEFRYSQSQAQLYQWMQTHQPVLFTQIRERITSGQWEAIGGMWVESDCNIPNGESLVRQFLFGKRYFRRELASDPQTAWLPDCFGFCYSLPQIMKECGIRWFVTTKLSWNQFTSFPYDTFFWQGVDGTRILCHFITTPDRRGWNDYSVDLNAANVKGCWDSYRQQQANHEVLLSFGWGDGGGGPTAEMLENGRRLNAAGVLPFCRQGSVEGFFHDLEQRVSDLPVWNDELYLQLHRGTYTSQAKIKKQNRECEALLHHLELLSSIAYLRSGWYPQAEINRAWESVLLNQFHDILPGSSIVEVYQDCDQVYEQVRKTGAEIIQQALRRIGL
ncbi:alpha-mannosidase, partial [bacterium]|nr:alpha-mannosidase [bacterium]